MVKRRRRGRVEVHVLPNPEDASCSSSSSRPQIHRHTKFTSSVTHVSACNIYVPLPFNDSDTRSLASVDNALPPLMSFDTPDSDASIPGHSPLSTVIQDMFEGMDIEHLLQLGIELEEDAAVSRKRTAGVSFRYADLFRGSS